MLLWICRKWPVLLIRLWKDKMDIHGYPEEHELDKIEKWDYNDIPALMGYVKERWKYANAGYFRIGRKYLYLSTGGWSGNESIIGALKANIMFWAICWWSSKRGGHYIFEVKQ